MLEVGRWFYCLGGILFLFFSSSCSAISRRDLSVTTILKVFRFLFFHFRNWFNKFFLSSISWKHRKLWDYRLLLSLPPEELDHLKSCRNSNRIVERTHRMLWAAPLPKSVQVSKSQPSPSPLPPLTSRRKSSSRHSGPSSSMNLVDLLILLAAGPGCGRMRLVVVMGPADFQISTRQHFIEILRQALIDADRIFRGGDWRHSITAESCTVSLCVRALTHKDSQMIRSKLTGVKH